MKTIISLLLLLLISQYLCSTTEPEEKKVSPPDTTSQNFSFETVEFGNGYGSSLFIDVWVFDENNIWGIGPMGSLVHYNGKIWKRINFDPIWNFYDITGNKYSGTEYAIAIKNNSGFIIVELKDESAKIIYDESKNNPSLKSADIKYYNDKLYLGFTDYTGTKIWYYDLLTQETIIQKTLPRKTSDVEIKQLDMRKGNDIYYLGNSMYSEFGFIHFNGIKYKTIFGDYQKKITFTGSHTDGNNCVAVGYSYDKAYITIISRY